MHAPLCASCITAIQTAHQSACTQLQQKEKRTRGGRHNYAIHFATHTMHATLPLPDVWPHPTTGVLTDIDDTLTRDGHMEPEALAALHSLRTAGVPVVAITGRPVGWSTPFALAWPVDAIVAENGSVRLQAKESVLHKHYLLDAATRAEQHAHLQRVLHMIEHNIPGARRATDSDGRETDIAIDHSEFTFLPDDRIAQVVALMRTEGLTATVSSIHINGWLGDHNKWTGAQWAVQSLYGHDLTAQAAQWVYVGDSTNDQVMFQHLPVTVGVANIRRFEHQLTHRPRYITPTERGRGFAELTRAVLRSRQASPNSA